MKKRTALKKVGLLGIAATVIPAPWTKPLINSVILPAHAMTSNCSAQNIVGEWIFAFGNPADDLVPINFSADGTGRLLDNSPITWTFDLDRLIVNVLFAGTVSVYDGNINANCSTITGLNLQNNDPFTATRSNIGF
jgi:hypothetical protein